MIRQNRIKVVLTVGVVALAVFAGPAQAGPLWGELGILTPETLAGNNPATSAPWASGDSYRFAFITSTNQGAESSDITTYNALVQGLANASTAYDIGADEGVTWNVIGSTDEVDARDNTSTNPTVDGSGHAIFLLDGSTVVAIDYADLWDGEVRHIINITEEGDEKVHWPFTGTYTDGTAAPGHPTSYSALGGGGQIHQGNGGVTTEWIWRTWTGDPPATLLPLYAMSEPLVIVVNDPMLPTVDAGGDMITWSGQGVLLDPNVDNNSDPVTALTYGWSANPETGVVFTPNANVEAPTVTITKAAGDAAVVTLTLAVNNVGSGKDDVTDTMTIDVYDDSCLAAKGAGPVELDPTDFNGNCITNFEDFAELALAWLYDYSLIAPEPN